MDVSCDFSWLSWDGLILNLERCSLSSHPGPTAGLIAFSQNFVVAKASTGFFHDLIHKRPCRFNRREAASENGQRVAHQPQIWCILIDLVYIDERVTTQKRPDSFWSDIGY